MLSFEMETLFFARVPNESPSEIFSVVAPDFIHFLLPKAVHDFHWQLSYFKAFARLDSRGIALNLNVNLDVNLVIYGPISITMPNWDIATDAPPTYSNHLYIKFISDD